MRTVTRSLGACLVVALLVTAVGCENLLEDEPESEGTYDSPVVLTVGATHSGTVGAWGTSYYRFTATVGGVYTIALTQAESDLSWELSDASRTYIQDCDDHTDASNEIATTIVALSAGAPYYLTVDEWDDEAGEFKLLVSAP